MHKKLFITACLLFSIVSVAAFAQSVTSIAIVGASLLQCTGNVIEGKITPAAYSSSGATIGSFSATQYYTTSNGGVAPQSATFTSGANYTFYLAVGTGAVTYADVYLISDDNPAAKSGTVRIHCDGRVEFLGRNGADDRMNYANGDLINVLYSSFDSEGKGAVKVFSLDADSVGVFEGSFGYELFEPYLDNPPAVNTFLGRVNYSRLYALTSGEFQIIVDDPLEAKTYTTVFSAFPISAIYFN